MISKATRLYLKQFNKIIKDEEIKEYNEIKKYILIKCKKNKSYYSSDYLKVEIERISILLNEINSPYTSILYAIITFIIPLLADNILHIFKIDTSNFNMQIWTTILIYEICIMLYFYIKYKEKLRLIKCCNIYIAILKGLIEELKKEELLYNKVEHEVAITEDFEINN